MDTEYGDVVAHIPIERVAAVFDGRRRYVKFQMPGCGLMGEYKLSPDAETRSRMVEGDVSVLVVVRDREDG